MRRFTVTATAVALLTVGALVAGGCSGDSNDSKSSGDSTASTTTTFKFSGRDSEAWCRADRKVQEELSQPVAPGAPTEEVKSRVDKTMAALDDLHAKASGEIDAAVATIRDAYRKLLPSLAKVGYDVNKLDADARKLVEGPDVQKAADRLSAYERQVCKFDSTTGTPTG